MCFLEFLYGIKNNGRCNMGNFIALLLLVVLVKNFNCLPIYFLNLSIRETLVLMHIFCKNIKLPGSLDVLTMVLIK